MDDPGTPSLVTRLGRTKGGRSAVFLAMLVLGFAVWFVALSFFQGMILPTEPGGESGPWIVRPILAMHFGACAVMSALSLGLLMTRLNRKWNAVYGTPPRAEFRNQAAIYIKAFLLMLVYTAGLIFYLLSWTKVGPDGIEQRLPWGRIHHAYEDVAGLESIPAGMRSETLVQDGPWYSITFRSGREWDLSPSNEGMSEPKLRAITTFIAKQAGQPWKVRPDVKNR